jgi:hypothetical protein
MTDRTRAKLAALLRCAAKCIEHGHDAGIEYHQPVLMHSGWTDERIIVDVDKLELPHTEETPS